MSVTTLKVSGREYILMSRKKYDQLTAAQEDRRAGVRAKKTLAQYRAGKLKTVSHEKVKRALGL